MSARRRRPDENSGLAAPPDPAAARVFELLARVAAPVTVQALRAEGISAPGQAVYELQVAGYEIDRMTIRHENGCTATAYRLRPPAPESTPVEHPVRGRDSAARARRVRGAERPAAVTPRRSRRQTAARPR